MSELAEFVLNAFRQAGGIVEPPAYAIHEVLLPEEVARRWQVDSYLRVAFADAPPPEGDGGAGVTLLGYSHPLVETMMEEVRAEPASVRVYANDVRVDKRGLFTLAEQELSFPNAHLSVVTGKGETAALCQYVRYNFKAALITDEKRELLASAVMDAQTGIVVPELTGLEQLTRLEVEPAFRHLPAAPVRWLPGQQVLSQLVLEGLLGRATQAALDGLAGPLEALQRRAVRHLELDRARLAGYYDDLARDLERRIERTDDEDRRGGLEDKLATTQAERADKLADVVAKYRLRVELELINLQVIAQPKVLLPVQIENRTARVERAVVWDPLLHRIEPLTCDVCGRAARRLMLCSGEHLVHEECLAPEQCVDCRRVYCRLCGAQIERCVVCDRPVCVSSLNRCPVCRRGTCHEHLDLCHAADGQPAQLPQAESEPAAEPARPAEPAKGAAKPHQAPTAAPKRQKAAARARKAHSVAGKAPRGPIASRVVVQMAPYEPVVVAFVLAKGDTELAVRSWRLADEGILVACRCEKWYRCPADGKILVPASESEIEAQIEREIESLRREYHVPARGVARYAFVSGEAHLVPRVVLRGAWRG